MRCCSDCTMCALAWVQVGHDVDWVRFDPNSAHLKSTPLDYTLIDNEDLYINIIRTKIFLILINVRISSIKKRMYRHLRQMVKCLPMKKNIIF